MTTHPYIPLYVDDFEAATTHLTPAEDGIYNRLLRLCWRTPGCSIPDDAAWIARKIRISAEEFDRIAAPVIEEFFTRSRGRVFQKRLKVEYEDITRKKIARKKAGKAGGAAKALKAKEKEPSNATVLPADTRAFPEPYPEPDIREGSEDKSSGQKPPPDLDKEAWQKGVDLLVAGGANPKSARTMFGKLVRSAGGARQLLPAITQAQVNGTGDPASYLAKAAARMATGDRRTPRSDADEVARIMAEPIF